MTLTPLSHSARLIDCLDCQTLIQQTQASSTVSPGIATFCRLYGQRTKRQQSIGANGESLLQAAFRQSCRSVPFSWPPSPPSRPAKAPGLQASRDTNILLARVKGRLHLLGLSVELCFPDKDMGFGLSRCYSNRIPLGFPFGNPKLSVMLPSSPISSLIIGTISSLSNSHSNAAVKHMKHRVDLWGPCHMISYSRTKHLVDETLGP